MCHISKIRFNLKFSNFPYLLREKFMSNEENTIDLGNEFDYHLEKTCLSQHTLEAQTKMRTDKQLCDACISLDDGTVVHVHRIIMCAACEYFR